MKTYLKKLFKMEQVKEVAAVKVWVIEWTSRNGSYAGNVEQQFQAFFTKDDAEMFAQSLRDAFNLIKHTSGNEVEVREQEQ